MIEITLTKKASEIYSVINNFDNKFPRPISSRISDLHDYSRKLAEKACFVIALDQKKIIGFAAMYANDFVKYQAYLAQIAMSEEYQGKGASLLLLEACEKLALSQGMNRLRLEVDNINDRAIKFYEKNGFQLDSRDDISSFMSKYLLTIENSLGNHSSNIK